MTFRLAILFLLLCLPAWAQTFTVTMNLTAGSVVNPPYVGSIYVTNFGAVGDEADMQINITNGTSIVVPVSGSFVSGDIGKLVGIAYTNSIAASGTVSMFAYITNVVSGNAIVKGLAPFTGTNLALQYGTYDQPAFSNAMKTAASLPTNIIVSAGRYYLPPLLCVTSNSADSFAGINITSGGFNFIGQGDAELIGNVAPFRWYQDNSLHRGFIVAFPSPMSNPTLGVTFSNIVFNGDIVPAFVNQSSWDEQCHAICDINVSGSTLITNLGMYNCTVEHISGEGMEETSVNPGLILTANNSTWTDCGGSCVNNFCIAANGTNNICHDANFAMEYYGNFPTNRSYVNGWTFSNLFSTCAISMPGNFNANAGLTIENSLFTNVNCAVFGGAQLSFINNTVNGNSQGGTIVGVEFDDGVGQEIDSIVSNCIVTNNAFTSISYPYEWYGSYNIKDNIFADNFITNASGIKYYNYAGTATNNWVTNNTCSNVGADYPNQVTGYFEIFSNNPGQVVSMASNPTIYGTNVYYPEGDVVRLDLQSSVALTNTPMQYIGQNLSNSKIPNGATETLTNTGSGTDTVYSADPTTGTALGTISSHTAHTFTFTSGAWAY